MKAELVNRANNSWSRRLGSLAVVSAGAYPELNAGFDAFNNPDHYYQAIQRVLDAAHKKAMPIRSSLSARLMRTSGSRSLSTESFTKMASSYGPEGYKQTRRYYESIEPLHMKRFTHVIDELAHGESDQQLRSDLEQISEGVAHDDKKLKLKITLDGLRTTLENTDLNKAIKRRVFNKITDAMIPELQVQDPQIITPDLLFDLQNYGLMEYVDLDRYFHVPFGVEEVGHSYRMQMSFMGRPSGDDVSSIPYEQRMETYRQEKGEYEKQRSEVSQQLNILEEHQNPRHKDFFTGYNEGWIASNLDTVGQVLTSVLENEVTSKIIQTCDPRVNLPAIVLLMRPSEVSTRRVNGLRSAIMSMYAHTRDFPTEDNILNLSSALNCFRNLTMELYDLEEKRSL